MAIAVAGAVVANNGDLTESQNIKSCVISETGMFLLTYDDDFTPAPGVAATSWGTGFLVGVNIMAENCCQVQVKDLKGNLVNSGFAFLAVGTK